MREYARFRLQLLQEWQPMPVSCRLIWRSGTTTGPFGRWTRTILFSATSDWICQYLLLMLIFTGRSFLILPVLFLEYAVNGTNKTDFRCKRSNYQIHFSVLLSPCVNCYDSCCHGYTLFLSESSWLNLSKYYLKKKKIGLHLWSMLKQRSSFFCPVNVSVFWFSERYSEKATSIQQEESVVNIQFVILNCSQLKSSLVEHCNEWQTKFTQILSQLASTRLKELYDFMHEKADRYGLKKKKIILPVWIF